MSIANLQAAYKQNATHTASPGELTLMLYNGCLKFINLAKVGFENKNIEDRNENLLKAQDIIRELMITLKTDTEIGKNMMRLYDFILSRLFDANIKNDLNALLEAETFVKEFRDTWKEVIKLERQQRLGTSGTDSVGGKA